MNLFPIELGWIVITQALFWNSVLSGLAAVTGLFAHNLFKALLNDDIDFVITLPVIVDGKIRIGGSITTWILAFVVGTILLDPVLSLALGYAGADALKDILRAFEVKRDEHVRPLA